MDIVSFGRACVSMRGNCCCLVLTCLFSKFLIVIPMPNQKAETVAWAIIEHVLPHEGLPAHFLSDRGVQFTSEIMKALCDIFQIERLFTTTCHPQGDGQTERANRSLIGMLSKSCAQYPQDWDRLVPFIVQGYNATVHSSSKHVPFYLLHFRQPRIPSGSVLNAVPSLAQLDFDRMQDTLPLEVKRAWDLVRGELVRAKAQQKEYYDKSAKDHSFVVGDKVMVRDDVSVRGKLTLPYRGPWEIVELTPTNAVVRMDKGSKTVTKKVHIEKLTKTHAALGNRTFTGDRRTEVKPPSLSPAPSPPVVPFSAAVPVSAGTADDAGEGGGVRGKSNPEAKPEQASRCNLRSKARGHMALITSDRSSFCLLSGLRSGWCYSFFRAILCFSISRSFSEVMYGGYGGIGRGYPSAAGVSRARSGQSTSQLSVSGVPHTRYVHMSRSRSRSPVSGGVEHPRRWRSPSPGLDWSALGRVPYNKAEAQIDNQPAFLRLMAREAGIWARPTPHWHHGQDDDSWAKGPPRVHPWQHSEWYEALDGGLQWELLQNPGSMREFGLETLGDRMPPLETHREVNFLLFLRFGYAANVFPQYEWVKNIQGCEDAIRGLRRGILDWGERYGGPTPVAIDIEMMGSPVAGGNWDTLPDPYKTAYRLEPENKLINGPWPIYVQLTVPDFTTVVFDLREICRSTGIGESRHHVLPGCLHDFLVNRDIVLSGVDGERDMVSLETLTGLRYKCTSRGGSGKNTAALRDLQVWAHDLNLRVGKPTDRLSLLKMVCYGMTGHLIPATVPHFLEVSKSWTDNMEDKKNISNAFLGKLGRSQKDYCAQDSAHAMYIFYHFLLRYELRGTWTVFGPFLQSLIQKFRDPSVGGPERMLTGDLRYEFRWTEDMAKVAAKAARLAFFRCRGKPGEAFNVYIDCYPDILLPRFVEVSQRLSTLTSWSVFTRMRVLRGFLANFGVRWRLTFRDEMLEVDKSDIPQEEAPGRRAPVGDLVWRVHQRPEVHSAPRRRRNSDSGARQDRHQR